MAGLQSNALHRGQRFCLALRTCGIAAQLAHSVPVVLLRCRVNTLVWTHPEFHYKHRTRAMTVLRGLCAATMYVFAHYLAEFDGQHVYMTGAVAAVAEAEASGQPLLVLLLFTVCLVYLRFSARAVKLHQRACAAAVAAACDIYTTEACSISFCFCLQFHAMCMCSEHMCSLTLSIRAEFVWLC